MDALPAGHVAIPIWLLVMMVSALATSLGAGAAIVIKWTKLQNLVEMLASATREFKKEIDALKLTVAELEKQLAVYTALRDDQVLREHSQPYALDDYTPAPLGGRRMPPKGGGGKQP